MRVTLFVLLIVLAGSSSAQFTEYLYEDAVSKGDRYQGSKAQFYYPPNQVFQDHDSTAVSFSSNGWPDTIEQMPIDAPPIVPDRVLVYHHNQSQRTSTVEYQRTNGNLTLDDSIAYEYHATGALTRQAKYWWNANADTFGRDYSLIYQRLPNGKDTVAIETYYNATIGINPYSIITSKSYINNGKLKHKLVERDTGTGFYFTSQASVQYPNPLDSFVTHTWYNAIAQQWDTLDRELHYFNSNGQQDSLVIWQEDTTSGQLLPSAKEHYIYDNGKISKTRMYTWHEASQSWELDGRRRFEYNASGAITQNILEQALGDSTFTPLQMMEYTYNANGDMDTITAYHTHLEVFQPLYRTIYYWEMPMTIAEEPEPVSANVYPVPASNEMRFELPQAAQQITLRVYNMSGKRISLIRGEGNAITWHIPHRLEAGNYIYQIQTEAELFSGKVVVAGE